MFNYRILAVIKRELREKMFSKTFILSTILLPVFMLGIIGVQTFIMTFEGDDNTRIEVITEADSLTWNLQSEFEKRDFVEDSSYAITYATMTGSDFEQHLSDKKADLLSGKLTGIIFIPKTALENKEINYYSKTPKNLQITRRLEYPINKVLVETYFAGKNISDEDLTFARRGVDTKAFKVTKEEDIKEEGYGNMVLSYLFSFLLYISLLMMGSMTMQTVIQEKSNRIVEVLLSSVSSSELMAGKILGAAITGVVQMAIWLSPVMLVISTTWFALPPELTFSIGMGTIGYLLLNFFVGLLTFIGLFATIGSIFENPQDAQSGMWPVMLLIIIPFFIALSMMKNPTNPIASIAAFAPFSSIMVMPVKMTLVDVPIWHLIISFIINIGTIFALFPIAGKIYRIGILRTGKKPSWGEVIKWLKYKY